MVLEIYNLYKLGTQGYHFLVYDSKTRQGIEWRRFIGGDRYENSLADISKAGEISPEELPKEPWRKQTLEHKSSEDLAKLLEKIWNEIQQKGEFSIRASIITNFLRQSEN